MSDNGSRVSTLRKMGSLLRRPLERAFLEEERAKADAAETRVFTLQLEAQERMLEGVVRRVQEDPGDWIALGEGDGIRTLTESEHTDLRVAAVRASFSNSHAIGYLRTLGRFVMGQGPTFTPDVEDDDLVEAMSDWWARFRDLNGWDDFEDNLAHRTWRDGEVFVRQFVQAKDGPIAGVTLSEDVREFLRGKTITPASLIAEARKAPKGMVFVRFVAASDIADPTGKVSHGIITAENDVQTVLGYVIAGPDGKTSEVVPASEMLHVKIRSDCDVKRGRSQLESILRRMTQYERWLEARINLSIVRTSVVFIKRITGAQSPADVSAVRDAQTVDAKAGPASERRLKMLRGPTAIHTGPGVEYEFISPDLQAADAQADGRQIQLDMAASVGMPEYIFTGDASNANYASTLVAESPAIREFENWQDFFTPHFVRIYRWVMVEAAKAEAIEGLTVEIAEQMPVTVEWPPLEVRDLLKHTQAHAMMVEGGILSHEGWANAAGVDWEIERARIEAELDDAIGFVPPPDPVDDPAAIGNAPEPEPEPEPDPEGDE